AGDAVEPPGVLIEDHRGGSLGGRLVEYAGVAGKGHGLGHSLAAGDGANPVDLGDVEAVGAEDDFRVRRCLQHLEQPGAGAGVDEGNSLRHVDVNVRVQGRHGSGGPHPGVAAVDENGGDVPGPFPVDEG